MRRLAPFALLACAIFALPRVSHAQSLSSEQASPATVVTASVDAPTPAGPTLDDATVGIKHTAAQASTTPTNVAAVRHGDQPTALMIVGGAAFIAGALINNEAGTIIMVGGAAVGLYGLYLYLQ